MWISDIKTFAANFSISVKQARHLQCTGEHLVAHSEGGKASSSNIVAACRFCNVKRHARSTPREPKEFADFVQSRLQKGAWNTHLLS
ncbi:HNH endonuclease [Marinobacter sp. F4218]|uniref:HNH endonuclease n=1 Tax=Marinobacter sp. F4218 TaxID=2862868 RepID=UPI003A5CC66E